ncbi:MAG: glycosyltransferase family 1 protein, partial [Microcoleus sp. SIO2G3]|nr:glycosyltransferase family 1 protein [Microcoleus sp. SIO2G3]
MTQRILLYTDEPGVGGVAQYNHSILVGLVQRGNRAICIQSPADNPLIQEQRSIGVEHHWLSFDS